MRLQKIVFFCFLILLLQAVTVFSQEKKMPDSKPAYVLKGKLTDAGNGAILRDATISALYENQYAFF